MDLTTHTLSPPRKSNRRTEDKVRTQHAACSSDNKTNCSLTPAAARLIDLKLRYGRHKNLYQINQIHKNHEKPYLEIEHNKNPDKISNSEIDNSKKSSESTDPFSSRVKWKASAVDKAMPLAATTYQGSSSLVKGYASVEKKSIPLAAAGKLVGKLDKHLLMPRYVFSIFQSIIPILTYYSLMAFLLSLLVMTNAQLPNVNRELRIDDDISSLCDMSASMNLRRIYSGNWTCNGIQPVDRRMACGWNGVGCDESGSIMSLHLSKSGIRGSIPSSIGKLNALRVLNLASNKLSSAVPTSIGYLTALTSLTLSKNKFSSSIPTAIGYLTLLQSVVMSSNQLTNAVPTCVGSMKSLTTLGLSRNKLVSSIPSSIGSLSSLQRLVLNSNMLTSAIPSSFGFLTSLQTLILSYNALTSVIPSSIVALKSLQFLHLCHNKLSSTIPNNVGFLTSLQSLKLSYNKLTSMIPTSISSLSSLTVLMLNSNKITSSIPSGVGHLTQLIRLVLSHNLLTGMLPSSIGSLVSLQFFGLWEGAMSGPIPSTIGFLSSVTTMWLSSNKFSSVIPTSIGSMSSLQRLGVSYTKVTGSIPTTIGKLSLLRHIYMSGNTKLSYVIPTSLGLCYSLQLLLLNYNALTSVIPSSIGSLARLTALRLNGNKLTSSIPSSIGFLKSLQTLQLNNNMLSGSIPSSLGFLTSLSYLGLGSNSFTSSIPTCVWSLTNLNVLFLKANKLTGTLPMSIGQQTNLQFLGLNNNALRGSIPSSVGLLTNLVQLALGYNALTSSIPTAVGLLGSLQFLTLGNNQLSSSIPAQITDVSKLKLLGLEDNRLTGTVPTTICQPTLGYISMSGNKFLCVPWCQDDYDWNSAKVSFPRCQDDQDDLIFDIEYSLGVSIALEKTSVQSSSELIQSTHPSTSFSKFISEPNAFEYTVEIINYDMTGYLLFCLDSSCNNVIGKYGPDMYIHSNPATNFTTYIFDNLGDRWLIPYGVATLYIQHSSFYISFQPSSTVCPTVNYNYVCPIITFGLQLVLTTRRRYAVGWGFDSSPPYLSPSVASVYAAGLCQTNWKGISCDKGRVTDLSLSGLGMQGTLPTSIGLLTALTSLDVSGNLIRGSILSSVGMLSQLNMLALNSNSFTGTLPSSLMNSTRLYEVSIANNKLTGSIPTLLVSMLSSLQYLRIDGNLFSGEVSVGLCDVVSNRNLSVSLTNNPRLTCYQELCKGLMQSDQRKYILLDPSLKMCVPTSTPTVSPTSSPTSRTVSPASLGLLVVQPLLTRQQTIIISIICPLVFIAALSYVIWRKCFSEKATTKIAKKQTLQSLPIHMLLLKGVGSGKAVSKEHITDVIECNIHTVHCCDGDGNTVLDIISQGRVNKRVNLDSSHVHRILLGCLPNHRRYSEFDDMDGEDRSTGSGNQLLDWRVSMFQRQFSVKVDDIPTKHPKYGWCLAVQHNDDLFVLAVEKILSEHRQHVKALGDIEDDNRRKCKEIAGARIKESIARKLYLAERYQVDEGHAVHKSATSLVYFAIDHGVPKKIEAHETSPHCAKPADSVAPVNSITTGLSWNKNEEGSPSTKPSGNAPPSHEPAGVKPAAPRLPAALRLRMAAKRVVSMKSAVKLPDDRRVAVKLMRNKDQFLREVQIREKSNFDPAFVLPIIAYYGDPDDENVSAEDREVYSAFREDVRRKGYGEYQFCIVMEAGRFSLTHVINHDQMAGKDWDRIRDMFRNLTKALQHIHDKGIVHGDLKPLNVLIVGTSIKVIDLDAAANCKNGDVIGKKFSSAYIPPEMFTLDKDTDEVRARSESDDEGLLLAHPSQDMWALGCLLYLLATGRTLFHASSDDNLVEQDDFYSVYNWDSRKLSKKIQAVKDKFAKNLLSFLLDKDPSKRPSASRVLGHPFLTGTTPSRLQGEKAECDIFLSYRVASDSRIVEMLYDALIAKGLNVWWDKKCLLPGQNWEEGFCQGLVKSAFFVCLLSRGAIKHADHDSQNFEKLTKGSRCDNVLLEWRLALELKERGMISGVFPIMIGDLDSSTGLYGNYFSQGCHPFGPVVAVESVESKVREHLEREGHGLPYKDTATVREILTTVTSNQGGFLQGEATSAVNTLVKAVLNMVRSKSQLRQTSFRKAVTTVIDDNRQKRIDDLKSANDDLTHDVTNLKECLSDREQRLITLEHCNFEHEQRKVELEQRVIEQDRLNLELNQRISSLLAGASNVSGKPVPQEDVGVIAETVTL